MIEIDLVRSKEQAAAVYRLAYEFIDWLRDRYPEMAKEIDDYLEHQKFDEQIQEVLTHFNPPKGECLLAMHGGEAIGILMLKDIGGGVCEMNRMFVRESARGLGAGRALVEELKLRARNMGFETMTLSALPRHYEALSLYRSCGFKHDDREREAGNSENALLMKIELGVVSDQCEPVSVRLKAATFRPRRADATRQVRRRD
ncbi:GNAT family N-acetyltransferase [Limibaculum sp. FT325]|uniref:GNAT family N-acetyltransferase n=1 Tax=Thermohalobaculum sediminis TaxID=2939436 RepID=UPI0020BFF408|nr:GNAT family N-acetyltransferase [Limibaculum sediminis]MCL5779340.1 GNAT family N-acetyltransferase [Limibaculum sediminis]